MGVTRFFMILFIIACLTSIGNAATVSKIVAVVNSINLSEAELSQEINVLMPMNQTFHGKLSEDKMKKIRTEALKNLVDSELRAQDAERKGVKVNQQLLDGEIDKLVAKFKTKDSLIAAYTGAGFTEKTFARLFERRLLAEKAVQLEVDSKVTVTPEKVKNYYSVNEAKYSKPEEFRASHILLKLDPSATDEERSKIRSKAEEILKKIKNGESFEELAMKESDDLSRINGGDLGYFHAGQAVYDFESALLKLKIGETSNIVETIYGDHIIKLTDKRPPRQIPFDEIKDKIAKDLEASEKKQLLDRWMDRLYNDAKISYPGAQ